MNGIKRYKGEIACIRVIHARNTNFYCFSSKSGNAKGIHSISKDGKTYKCYDKDSNILYSIENTGIIVEYYK